MKKLLVLTMGLIIACGACFAQDVISNFACTIFGKVKCTFFGNVKCTL